MKKGRLVVISGPSGVGKTTLCRSLASRGIGRCAITCTTRAMRQGERDGVDYHFLSPGQFAEALSHGDFIEHATVHGQSYGIRRSTVDEALGRGETLLLNIDVQGASTVRKLFPDALTIFVDAPDQALSTRLNARAKDSPGTVQKRLEEAHRERGRKTEFDHAVTNDDLAACVGELEKLVISTRKEHHV
ncbi:MAG: guanylate kinase [Planctomycetota bacterium]